MSKVEGVDHWSDYYEFFDDGCPFCRSKRFLEGPPGGLSVNFKCAACRAKFNDMGIFGIELLSGPEKKMLVTAKPT